MKILHIDGTNKNMDEFNSYVDKNNYHIFVLFFMDGCGPCEMTRPEWKKIEDILDDKIKNNGDIVIADINQEVLQDPNLKINYLNNKHISINGFPTIHYIFKNGNIVDEFDGQRNAESFKQWIVDKTSKSNNNQFGGRGYTKIKFLGKKKKQRGSRSKQNYKKTRSTKNRYNKTRSTKNRYNKTRRTKNRYNKK